LRVWAKAVKLHKALEARLGGVVELHLMAQRGAMLRVQGGEGWSRIRLHHLFADADEATLAALAVLCSARRESKNTREARAVLQGFLQTVREGAEQEPLRVRVRTQGEAHDLKRLYDEALAYLGVAEAPGVAITWGRWGRVGQAQTHVRLGSFDPQRRLIRIHPMLDRAQVPGWVVGFVVFHELLHWRIPSRCENGRAEHHGPAFREAEARHPDFERYHLWLRQHLAGMLNP
jgi:hypothetical protein